MPIEIQCPGCRQRFRAQDHLLGKTVKCRCGTLLQIPKPAPQPPANDMGLDLDDALGSLSEMPLGSVPYDNLAPYQAPGSAPQSRGAVGKAEGGGSLKTDALIALAVSAAIFVLVCGGGLGMAGWYISTHPVPGATAEQRGAALGTGLGTLIAILLAIVWLPVGIRHAQRLERKKARQAAQRPGTLPSAARPRTNNRNLLIGLGIGGGVLALLLVLGIIFAVSAARKAARRAEIAKKMNDPAWREKYLGEKQGWRDYTDSTIGHGFSIELPNPPKKQLKNVGGAGMIWVVSAERPNETFSVTPVKVLMGLSAEQAAAMRGSVQQAAAALQARVTSQRDISVGEFSGVEFDYESLSGQKSFSGRIRMVATANTMFEIGWIVSPPAPANADVERFMNSFQLPDTAAKPKTEVELGRAMPPINLPSIAPRRLPTFEEVQARMEAERNSSSASPPAEPSPSLPREP